jgi:hypothetical protein
MSCSIYPKPSPKLPHSTNDELHDDVRMRHKSDFDGSGIAGYGTPIVLINREKSELCFAMCCTHIRWRKDYASRKRQSEVGRSFEATPPDLPAVRTSLVDLRVAGE